MRHLFLAGLVVLGSCTMTQTEQNEVTMKYSSPYMNARETPLYEIHQGAKVPERTKTYWNLPVDSPQRSTYDSEIMLEVADGVWTYGSASIVNLHAIEAPEGLVIYDTGDNDHDGISFYKALREVSNTPIKAIIYSHSHYSLGAGVILEEEARRGNEDIMIIGHPGLNNEMVTTNGLAALYPEISGVLMARTIEQFNMFLPDKGPDSPFKNTIIPGEISGYMPVNTPVNHLQKLNVAGMEMVFYTEDIATDTENQVLVYVPELNLVMNNVVWGWFPNIYSIRGGKFRNPNDWIVALDVIMDLDPDILLSSHSTSLDNKRDVQERLNDYKDGLAYMRDQTLKGIMLGMNPEELQYYVTLPKHLDEAPILTPDYGELRVMPGRIYTAAFGQYDRNASNIVSLHPQEEAKRMVLAMGGEKKTYKMSRKAFNDGDYIWAVQLADYLVKVNPTQKNKQLKADCLKEMGHRSFSTNNRSIMLSQALELEGKTVIPTAVPTDPSSVVNNLYDYFNYYRIRISPEKAEHIETSLAVDFGQDKVYGMYIRKGVVYTYEDISEMEPRAELRIKMAPETWPLIYNNLTSPEELINDNVIEVIQGSEKDARDIFGLFDPLFDWENDPALQMMLDM